MGIATVILTLLLVASLATIEILRKEVREWKTKEAHAWDHASEKTEALSECHYEREMFRAENLELRLQISKHEAFRDALETRFTGATVHWVDGSQRWDFSDYWPQAD